MDLPFTDNDSHAFLTKLWLVKIDNATSRPYLFKFHAHHHPPRACVLITDTKAVWFEAVNSKQLARRWRTLNNDPQNQQDGGLDDADEHAWRRTALTALSKMHTLHAVWQAAELAIEDSRDADMALALRTDVNWRWDAVRLPARTAADVLSQHLILPLLSVTRLAFTSPDPVADLGVEDLEKAVDKLAKSGRRAQDVHVRQTLSRPRVAATLSRITAMFNFVEPIPPILDDEVEDADVDMAGPPAPIPPDPQPSSIHRTPSQPGGPDPPTLSSGSATEPESDRGASLAPRPLKKKPKPADSDDEEGRKKGKKKAAVRQPIKRGGRRF